MRASLREDSGQTLVELMVASLVLVVGVLGTLVMIDGGNRRMVTTTTHDTATNLAREIIEGSRAVPYPSVTPASLEEVIQRQPNLADSSGATGWNLVRQGTTFTVAVDTCIMDDDDPRDGTGDHTGLGTFCPGSPGGGTTDRNPDDYKRVAVSVSWKGGMRTITVRQTAILNNPGSAFAPIVRTLTASSPVLAAPYRVLSASTTSVTFSATVTPRAAYVNWLVDNIKQGRAVRGANDVWTFNWPIPATVPDGVYLVGAEGFSASDLSGTGKALSVTLNRFKPQAPVLAGGRNGSKLEFEWSSSGDRDVIGYRVYQRGAAADTKVCETSVNDTFPTSCVISDIPGDNRFYAVAVAPACCAGSGTEESVKPSAADSVLVTTNVAPNPPKTLSATRSGTAVTLTWTAPDAPEAGEAGDTVRYYRIYRDGQSYGERFGQTSPTTLTFTDNDAGTGTHKYWVTTVDSHLGESAPVGEVEL